MSGGEGAAAFKGVADGAQEALGNAGHALGDFVETTAQSADKATDAMLATEERNAQAIANVMPSGAAADEQAAAAAAGRAPAAAAGGEAAPSPAPSKFSSILDPQATAEPGAWEGEGGLRLSPEENAAADRFLAQAKDAESNITPVVMGIRDEVPGAQTVGYPEFVLKSPDSFKRKLATTLPLIRGRNIDTALGRMKDTVRYTMTFPGEGTAYTDGVNAAISRFSEAGVKNVDFKPNWQAEGYKGINSFWRDPQTGHTFEVQFHTPESFDAKMVTHGLYEEMRIPGISDAREAELRAGQDEIFRTVPIPEGAPDIRLPER